MKKSVLMLLAAAVLVALSSVPRAQQADRISAAGRADFSSGIAMLAPTRHPPVPNDLSQIWLAPERSAAAARSSNNPLSVGVRLAAQGQYSKALAAVLQPITQQGLLADYATYYAGMSQLRLDRPNDALRTFKALRSRKLSGYLTEAAALGEASAYEALNEPAAALAVYEQVVQEQPMNLDDIYMKLGYAARLAHERNKAADAFGHVFYEFSLSEHAGDAAAQLKLLALEPAPSGSERYKLELNRAERLYAVKQYVPARAAFEALKSRATDQDRLLIQLRLAECDYLQRRTKAAKDALSGLIDDDPVRAEALYYYAQASRDLGDQLTYLRTSRRVVDEFPSETWAERALNELGSYYLKRDDDAAADEAFRELYLKYPKGAYGDRAAWKAGWRSYRQKRYAETATFFERAAVDFPRSDYRPSWLYWAGRAHDQLKNRSAAEQRYFLVVADYQNSYYGRLAVDRLGGADAARALPMAVRTSTDIVLPASVPPTAQLIRALLGAEMYEDALNEVRYAQKAWGDSPVLQATIAWINQQLAPGKSGMDRLMLARGSITTMRRAYPQFMAAGGEDLPRDVLQVIFPVAYWDLIRKNAATNNLDPYLMAALVAQESTFVPDVRSHANAYGLMQLLPSTARAYAQKIKVRYSTRILIDPELNVRMGSMHFADALKQFSGDTYLALAGYNAGDRVVRRWMQERPGLDRDEFIDDIPYPETQNYVKRILGTAEDYRRLYGPKS